MKKIQVITLIAATGTLLLSACSKEDIAPQGLLPDTVSYQAAPPAADAHPGNGNYDQPVHRPGAPAADAFPGSANYDQPVHQPGPPASEGFDPNQSESDVPVSTFRAASPIDPSQLEPVVPPHDDIRDLPPSVEVTGPAGLTFSNDMEKR